MDRERFELLTRAKVLQLGFLVFALGAIGYWAFRFLGYEGAFAGIAAEALLILIVVGWTGTYLFSVLTGRMTFMEQRKRYLQEYEKLTNDELQARFDAMSDQEKIQLMKELESDKEVPPSNL